jgi:bacteriocin biosynthesis cyclodehydratase domain-containing protein
VLLQLLLRLPHLQPLVTVSPQLPELPLLAPWYRLVETTDGLVLEHGQRVLALGGAAARTLLPRLLPLLDGTRTVDEIVAVVGVAAERAVAGALRLLRDNGVLVEGPPPACGDEFAETVSFLAAEGGESPATVAGRLTDASVGVVGSGLAGTEAARILRRAGVARIGLRRWDAAQPDDLTVVAPGGPEAAELAAWNDRALATGRPWLLVLPYDGVFAGIGPLFVPGETACHECYRLRRAAAMGIGVLSDALDGEPVRAGGGPALAVAAGATATTHVLRWLAIHDPSLPGVLFALEPRGGLTLSAHAVLRVPRCPVCSGCAREAAPLPWYQPGVGEAA